MNKHTLNINKISRILIFFVLSAVVSACSTSQQVQQGVNDPFEKFNRSIYAFNDTIDTHVSQPVARTWKSLPDPLQTGVSNFFNNIDDVVTLLNDFLQLKFEQGMITAMRVAANSTFGMAGLIDIATDWGLPRHEERFADTLGFWGVPSGPYLVLPILGPSSFRDAPAIIADIYAYPLGYLYPVNVRNSLQGLKMVNNRAKLLAASQLIDDVAVDKYTFTRDTYFQWRQNQIYDGNPPLEIPEDFDTESLK